MSYLIPYERDHEHQAHHRVQQHHDLVRDTEGKEENRQARQCFEPVIDGGGIGPDPTTAASSELTLSGFINAEFDFAILNTLLWVKVLMSF